MTVAKYAITESHLEVNLREWEMYRTKKNPHLAAPIPHGSAHPKLPPLCRLHLCRAQQQRARLDLLCNAKQSLYRAGRGLQVLG